MIVDNVDWTVFGTKQRLNRDATTPSDKGR